MPETNKSNELEEPSMPDANELPDTYEDEVIVDDELKEPSRSRVTEKLPDVQTRRRRHKKATKTGCRILHSSRHGSFTMKLWTM
jgi:hypothetical protein